MSLAHGGVLFLDELAEFPRAVLDQLRQPLEEGVYRLSRARLKASFPAWSRWWPPPTPAPAAGTEIVTMAAAAATANGSATGNASPVRCWIDWICSCDWNGGASAIRSSLSPDATAPPEPWIHPDQIRAARRQMIQRNPHRVCNRDLSAHDLGRHGQFTPSAAALGATGGAAGTLHPQWDPTVARRPHRGRSQRP